MLLIEKDQEVPLPEVHHLANNLCAVIYDQLTAVLADSLYDPLRRTEITFSETSSSEQFDESELHILDYLQKHGKNTELNEVLVKHLLLSILSDFTSFVYESLSCAQRGKVGVSYALLRKPFKDELILLESLLIDPTQFMEKFFRDGNPANYDPSKFKDDVKREIIASSVSLVEPPFFDTNTLFTFRYDKSNFAGISSFSDHALHIVTQNPNYPTPDQNFNFIFSVNDDMDRYWKHYYSIVPYLLLYTAAVVDAIAFKYLPGINSSKGRGEKILKRASGFALWLKTWEEGETGQLKEAFEDLFTAIKLECTYCGITKNLEIVDVEQYFFTDLFTCDNCHQTDTLNFNDLSNLFTFNSNDE